MSVNEYSAQQALDLLMRGIHARSPEMAAQIQAVLDAGREQTMDVTDVTRRAAKISRSYRKTVPYSFEEALQVAVDALRAYFIEQPLFVDSCLAEISAAALEPSAYDRHSWALYKERNMKFDDPSRGQPKVAQIELRTETQISESAQDTLTLEKSIPELIEVQRRNLDTLRSLIDFQV